ncbi:MAG: type VI secretion system tube protein Hcp [Opitutaceae bacterium]|jgi:type VI secretion system Hcp family effector|nr:type VI secretion system tube protein Hcp [Opitutaceae bacterium]
MAVDAYLYIMGMENLGESQSEYASKIGLGAIEITDYGFGITMPIAENRSATGAATTGRADLTEFECTKNLDASTAHLCHACMSGRHIEKITCRIFRSVGETNVEYVTLEFTDVLITSCTVSGSGDELPKESLKFSYGAIKYTYTVTDHATGKATSEKAQFVWDEILNKGDKKMANPPKINARLKLG